MRLIKDDLENSNISELVIVVDMVNGFVKFGNLAAPSIMRVVENQKKLISDFYNDPNKGVIFIRDSHNQDAVEFKTYGVHCIEGTDETLVIDELSEFNSIDYLKNSTNFMFAPGFSSDILKLKNLKKVILVGCLSEVCVRNGGVSLRNFFDQMNIDVEVCVLENGIDTYDAPSHNALLINSDALKDMESNGIKIIK